MTIRSVPWPVGTPCWADMSTTDTASAVAFYGPTLGWSCDVQGPEFGGYVMCRVDGHDVAGFGPMGGDGPPAWLLYFATDDADRTAAGVSAAGGTVLVAPMDVGDRGRMAVAMDPQGAAFGLWQSGATTGAELVNAPGGLTWEDLSVADADAARAFYGGLFGFEFDALDGAGTGYTTFATAGHRDWPMGGIGTLGDAGYPAWLVYFAVVDTDAAVSAAQANGGRLTRPAWDSPYGRMALLADPGGAVFAVISVAAESPAD